MKYAEKGNKATAQRMVNAEENFVEMIMQKGFSREDATKAMRTMLKLKVAKMDAVIGRITVLHGAYLEIDVIQNAVEYEE